MREQDSLRIRHLGFLQLEVTPGRVSTALCGLERALAQLAPPRSSLLVLPELWATGFAYGQLANLQDEVARLPDRLQELAGRYGILLAGSLPEQRVAPDGAKEDLYYNTLQLIGASGVFGIYRKRHIFPGEEAAFCPESGNASPIATPAGRLGCLICYDLRFPALARSQCQQGAELLLCSAQWPLARVSHWRVLAIARAIENQTFVVACNGVGRNGGLTLGGHSLVVSPMGEVLLEAGEGQAARVVEIDWRLKREAQAGFRSFTVEPYSPAAAKIATAETCAADAASRAGLGQRVVYVALEPGGPLPQNIAILESARQRGDYLVLGVPPPAGSHPEAIASQLHAYAALGCVDAVFALDQSSPAVEKRLRENCLTLG